MSDIHDENRALTRRKFWKGIGPKALALAIGILGLSDKAAASPFCCNLIFPSGGLCDAPGGCIFGCNAYFGTLVFWTCNSQGHTY